MKSSDIARLIDHSILHPTYTDEDLKKQCEIAIKYKVTTVCVKPYHVNMASKILKGSEIGICAVIGFPHGNNTIDVKVHETKQVCADGATEVDMVVNIGKVLQNDWDYINSEIEAIHSECLKNQAILKVIFENDFLPESHYKIKLCEICNNQKVEFVKTSTGYGFVKDSNGNYSYNGATVDDLRLMRKHTIPSVQIKAAGGIRNLDQLLKAVECGASRIGASATEKIINEAIKRYGE